jgi:hypothetical protein
MDLFPPEVSPGGIGLLALICYSLFDKKPNTCAACAQLATILAFQANTFTVTKRVAPRSIANSTKNTDLARS